MGEREREHGRKYIRRDTPGVEWLEENPDFRRRYRARAVDTVGRDASPDCDSEL